MRLPVRAVIAALPMVAGIAVAQVDYSVYFWPAPGGAPERTNSSGMTIERQFAVLYHAGPAAGTHPYKLLLRAFAPDGTLACETTTTVTPWEGKSTMKKVAWFEAGYSEKAVGAKVRPGKYLLRAYLTEQIVPAQKPEDANLSNNQYPFEPPRYMPVEFEVRSGADEIRCAVPSAFVTPESLPPGFIPPMAGKER